MSTNWISDWNNICYPFSEQSWTRSYTTQVHIGRQNEDNKTLCGRDSTSWGGANPEPDNPDPDKCYASCKTCVKTYNRLRSYSKNEVYISLKSMTRFLSAAVTKLNCPRCDSSEAYILRARNSKPYLWCQGCKLIKRDIQLKVKNAPV